MISNQEKLSVSGLLFLHYIQKSLLYKEEVSQLLQFLKNFHTKKPDNSTTIRELFDQIKNNSSKELCAQLLKIMNVSDSRDLKRFINLIPSIINLYNELNRAIVKNRPRANEITGTYIPKPGDIISFLKILFLSRFQEDIFKELLIFVNTLNPGYTVQNISEIITRKFDSLQIQPEIMPLLLPKKDSIGSAVTLDLDKKIYVIKNIVNIIT